MGKAQFIYQLLSSTDQKTVYSVAVNLFQPILYSAHMGLKQSVINLKIDQFKTAPHMWIPSKSSDNTMQHASNG